MATQAREQEKRLQFKAVNYNANKLAPEAAVGKYQAVIDAVQVGADKNQDPSITLIILLKKALSKGKGPQKSIGATPRTWISFPDDEERRGNRDKLKFRALCDQLGVKTGDVLPTRIEDAGDFKKLLKVLKKAKITVWLTEYQTQGGETRISVNFSAPRSFLADESNGVDDSEEEEDEDSDDLEDDDDEDSEEEESDDEDSDDEDSDEEDDDDDEEEEEDDRPKKKKGKK